MTYHTIAIPPTPEAGAALVDAWGGPATSVSYDAATNQVTVITDGFPANWPGSQGDPAGAWRLVYAGPPEAPV